MIYDTKAYIVYRLSQIFDVYDVYDVNLTYIVYRKYFRVDRKPVFMGSARPKRKANFMDSIDE